MQGLVERAHTGCGGVIGLRPVADVDVVLVRLFERPDAARGDPHVDAKRRHGSVPGVQLVVREERLEVADGSNGPIAERREAVEVRERPRLVAGDAGARRKQLSTASTCPPRGAGVRTRVVRAGLLSSWMSQRIEPLPGTPPAWSLSSTPNLLARKASRRQRDRVVRVDAREVVPERERALRVDLRRGPFLNSGLKIPSPSGSPRSRLGKSAFATSRMTGACERSQITRNWCLPRMSSPGVKPARSILAAPLMTAIPGLSDDTCTGEAQPALVVEVGDRVPVRSVEEGRAGVVLVDAAPVLHGPGLRGAPARGSC